MKKVLLLSQLLLFLFIPIFANRYFLESKEDISHSIFNKVYEKVYPAVVNISTERTVRYAVSDPFFDFFFNNGGTPYREGKEKSIGSGFIISKDGYIVTNNHVIQKADKIYVRLSDGEKYSAKLIGTDPELDIAVIKIDANRDLPIVKFGDSDKIKVGDWTIAIGNPFGLERSLTVGVLSAKGRDVGGKFGGYLQTDTAINPGNSGGPLLDINGNVIGINTMIYAGGAQNIGFAIPINIAKKIIPSLIEKGNIERVWLGVSVRPLDDQYREYVGLNEDYGLVVLTVEANSPAENAGIKVGDVILKIDGMKVKHFEKFARYIAFSHPGRKVKLVIYRDGKYKKLTATLRVHRKGNSYYRSSQNKPILSLAGMKLKNRKGGVEIVAISPNSFAYGVLMQGDIILSLNKHKISSVNSFKKILKKLKKVRTLYFIILRDGRREMVVVSR